MSGTLTETDYEQRERHRREDAANAARQQEQADAQKRGSRLTQNTVGAFQDIFRMASSRDPMQGSLAFLSFAQKTISSAFLLAQLDLKDSESPSGNTARPSGGATATQNRPAAPAPVPPI